ncbi:MAG: helix-turn-helix transcriptional regulator [Lachnospiraceae bacterium]|nr:helix-turn-helix transcriptional regulator [Lachnospiraceae bacterium]
MQYFGEKLKEIRIKKGLSQKDFASRIGVVGATVSAYENGKKYPSVDILIKICSVYDVSADYLLGLSDQMELLKTDLNDYQLSLIRQLIHELEHYE